MAVLHGLTSLQPKPFSEVLELCIPLPPGQIDVPLSIPLSPQSFSSLPDPHLGEWQSPKGEGWRLS